MFLGITGGIGAGKSTLLSLFEAAHWGVSDADLIIHQIYDTSEAVREAVISRWSLNSELSGQLFRNAIAEQVFGQADELEWLEKLLHPAVKEAIEKERALGGHRVCAVPLLFEKGWENLFDATLTVICTDSIQQERLLQRGWTPEQIQRRLDCQLSMREKAHRSNFVIENSGSLTCLQDQLGLLLKQWPK